MLKQSGFRRPLKVVAASIVVAMIAAACGGSAVTEAGSVPAAGAEVGPMSQPATAAISPGVAPATVSVAPGQTGESGAVGAPAVGAEVPGAGSAGGTAKPGGAAKSGGGPASAADATEAGLAGAVQKLVRDAPIFGGTAACKPATLSPVNIGNVSTLSGVLGELFEPAVPALQTFVASQNACGGLNGHPIKFYQEDDQGDPSTAISKTQALIQQRKVIAFVGNIEVLTIDAIVPTIKSSGIPIIGGDITNNTWFTNPLLFPQGPTGAQAVPYGYITGAIEYHKKKNIGNIWCIEVPRGCEQMNRAMKELAPKLGANFVKDIQVSITAPSYVQQCLEFKNAGVEVLALTFDAASMVRLARSCEQVGYFPKVMPYPLAVGNEKQFLGNKWLGDAYVPLNTFPWMGNTLAAEKYYQATVRKYNPGFDTGGAASLAWTAGALLVAASAGLSAAAPTTQQLLDTLHTFKRQKVTQLGGLSPSPLTYQAGGNPKIPYCLYAMVSNDQNTGWKKVISAPSCTTLTAPSDPQNQA